MRPLGRIVALIRADIPLAEIAPWRSLGADAYELVEDSPPASWERLAAWSAFVLQLYGDSLVAATESCGYVPADTAATLRQVYGLSRVWLERAKQLRASPESRLEYHLSNPLPHWPALSLRSNGELRGMRTALEAVRARVALDLRAYDGPAASRTHLAIRLVAVESALETVDLLWIGRGSDELRAAIGKALEDGLQQGNELGQLLAQPALLARLPAI
ncbi:MAG TPA: hypothetical protein VGM80_05500 [Gaiellaceae bacterium]|jgi:hypothetical protein